MAGQKINIALNERTHSRAKALAAIKGVSLNKFFEEAIRKSVKQDKGLFGVLK